MSGRPALEGAVAVALVGGHHRVAVVPVELRLGVEPEQPAGALGDLGEDLGVRLAAVGAGVAEHDHGRARVEVVGDLGQELEPDAAVVGVAGDVGDAALAGDLLGDDGEVALVLEDVGHLGDPLDEDEAAQFAERVVEGVEDREEEDAGRGDRGGDVAEDVDLRPPRPLRPVAQPQRHAAGLQRGAHRPPHVDHWPLSRPRCSWPRVASRRFICETARWTAARSWVGLVGSARSSSASGREGGRVSVRSIRSRSSSRRRWRSNPFSWSRSIGGRSLALLGRRLLRRR